MERPGHGAVGWGCSPSSRPSSWPPPPSAARPPLGSEEPPPPQELPAATPFWPGHGRLGLDQFGLDRVGLTQAIGGLALGLIALFSSYNHLTFAGRDIPIPQQWGIPLIAASVAIVFVVAEGISAAVAQLATGSRLRAAHERKLVCDRAEQRENEAY